MSAAEFFRDQFGKAPDHSVFVPGRVNLIGEHIDYNGGRVLPHALHRGVSLALSLRADSTIRVSSDRFDGLSEGRLDQSPSDPWAKYAVYTCQLARDLGWIKGGADLGVVSDLSDGAGLSSSAALCVAVLKALREATKVSVSDVEIAQLARRVENEYIGMPCGIMDQMAVAVARPGQALYLDTASLDFETIPLPEDVAFVVMHSGIHRELADGRYKQRKEECDVAKEYFGTEDLCHLSTSQLDAARGLDETIQRRVRHCISEHIRVVEAARLLKNKEFTRFGAVMRESHISMRDDFEMSMPEIDALVETAMSFGALGARLTGGGFGGCIVAAVPAHVVQIWKDEVLERHPNAFVVE